MNDKRFRATSFHKVDAKGRVCLPERFRHVLESQGDSLVTLAPLEGYLVAYPIHEWEAIEERILNLSGEKASLRRLVRHFMGSACQSDPDEQGRLLLPAALRHSANIEAGKSVALVGVLTHFEVWSKDLFEKDFTEFEQDLLEEGMGHALADLGL